MANITWLGASYSDVPWLKLPKTGGGQAQFDDTTIASDAASASDIANGKKAYVNGSLVTGSASGGSTLASTTKKMGNSNATSISFTVSGQPKAFMVMLDQQSSLGSTRYVISVAYDGTTTRGCWGYSSSNTRYAYYSDSYFSWTYSNGTLTVSTSSSSNGGYFRSSYTYRLIYAY